VLVICCLLNALDGMDIVIFSYIAPVLIENWHITPGTMGIIFSASLWGMMIGCLFIAPLADRFGRRRLMLIMLAIIGCSMIASGLSRSVPELLATRFAIGIGIGAILASMAALVSEYAPPNQAGLAVSIENAGYPLGAVATGLLAAKLLPIYGWQHLLLGAGVLSLLAFVLTALLLPESVDFLLSVQPRGALPVPTGSSPGWAESLSRPFLPSLPRPGNSSPGQSLIKAGPWARRPCGSVS
jgi:MFS family permease